MEIKIDINISDVLNRIHSFSAYTGVKEININGEDSYKRISTITADEPILKDNLYESFSDLETVLGKYNPNIETTSENVNLKLVMPSNFDTKVTAALKDVLRDYYVSAILYRWFQITNKHDAEACLQRANSYLVGIRRLLSRRVAPNRTPPSEIKYTRTKFE